MAFGRGKIGYTEINSLDELQPDIIARAPILENQFAEGEWGGANDLVLLKDGRIGVLGHIAHYETIREEEKEKQVKNYYAMVFVFDPQTSEAGEIEIIATTDELPIRIEPKMATLGKVIFSGGIKRNGDGTAHLYTGIGDIKAASFTIQDPFVQYES